MLGFGSFGGLVLLQGGGGFGVLLPILFIALVAGAIALAVRRARGKPQFSEAFSSIRTVGHEQRKQPMNNRITKGIIVLVFGVALIIISPSLTFTETVGRDTIFGFPVTRTTDLRNVSMFFGVALLIVGGIISAVGISQFMSTQPPAPTTQPVVTQSVSPKSVELGDTADEVQSVMGQPDKIINLGERVIHVYQDMKIIYVDGKVSDVELS